jgi:hypothetical protein
MRRRHPPTRPPCTRRYATSCAEPPDPTFVTCTMLITRDRRPEPPVSRHPSTASGAAVSRLPSMPCSLPRQAMPGPRLRCRTSTSPACARIQAAVDSPLRILWPLAVGAAFFSGLHENRIRRHIPTRRILSSAVESACKTCHRRAAMHTVDNKNATHSRWFWRKTSGKTSAASPPIVESNALQNRHLRPLPAHPLLPRPTSGAPLFFACGANNDICKL